MTFILVKCLAECPACGEGLIMVFIIYDLVPKTTFPKARWVAQNPVYRLNIVPSRYLRVTSFAKLTANISIPEDCLHIHRYTIKWNISRYKNGSFHL